MIRGKARGLRGASRDASWGLAIPRRAIAPVGAVGPQTGAEEPEGLDKQTDLMAPRPWWVRWFVLE